MSGAAQQCSSAFQARRAHRFGQRLGCAVAQEVAQQRVELKGAAVVTRHLAHEIVVARQVEQQAPGSFLSGERLGDFRAHARQAGDPEEELLDLRFEAVEDFAREIIEDHLWRRVPGQLGDAAGNLRMLEHQHQPCRPALRALVELRHLLRCKRVAAQTCDAGDLLRPDAQVLPADVYHPAAHAHARERRLGFGAAGDQDPAIFRNLRETCFKRRVQRARRRHLVQIVKYQRGGSLGAHEQLAEEAAGKRRNVAGVLRRKRRQFPRPALVKAASGVSQIMEESRNVGVVGIYLVPDAAKVARLDVARRERALAGSRRTRDPGHGPSGATVEAREYRLAPHDASDYRPRRFREGDAPLFGLSHLLVPRQPASIFAWGCANSQKTHAL